MADDGQEWKWMLYVDGSSNNKGSGVEVILEDINKVSIKQFLRFMFKTSNNQAKYEALIADLKLAEELGVQWLVIKGDSQLVIGQVKGEFQAKKSQLQKYHAQVKEIMWEFEECTMEYIPRNQNS